tara:strand:+ start:117 stop:596 length:480 start_codon:yes stop_codon:yes gene_type:complete
MESTKSGQLAKRLLQKKEKPKRKLKQSDIFEMAPKAKTPKTPSKKNKTYKEKFNLKFNGGQNVSNSKAQISKLSKIPISIINKVYDRGIGAYKTNLKSVRLKSDFSKNPDLRKGPSKRLSKEQWAIARVYAFVMKALNKSEPQNQDLDLIEKVRDLKKK